MEQQFNAEAVIQALQQQIAELSLKNAMLQSVVNTDSKEQD